MKGKKEKIKSFQKNRQRPLPVKKKNTTIFIKK